jgi:hypothetical protein
VSGAYWFGWVITFLSVGPYLCARIDAENEELMLKVTITGVLSLFWPLLLVVVLLRWRLRVRRAGQTNHSLGERNT